MFEKIVERILNRILGEYVQDFSSENLKIGLWSGAVEIKNVKLKKEIIQKLNLPFNLKYSRLGCLKMNIPWSSITSSKIEVVIEGLELLITEQPEKDWNCKNHRIIEERKKEVQAFCESIAADFAKKAEKTKKEETEEGYFSKMVVKIIDNIQVTIKNIHVRYEDEITNNYSFGVTLEELKIYTVNRHGEPEFIDRTKKEYQNEPLRKKLILSEFGVYWNEKSDFFQGDLHGPMTDSIARKDNQQRLKMNYLILMSSNAMLYQREAGKQFEEPEINLQIGFEQLKIEITNQQLQQIVNLSERLQKYTNEVKAQNRKKLTQLEMIANRELFLQIFPKYFEKTITPQEEAGMDSILEKMEVANFEDGIKKYLMTKQKEKMISEKKEKSRGWFSGPKEITEEEKQEIEKFLEDNFGTEVVVVKRPEDFYYIKVDFSLKKLEIVVANEDTRRNTREGIRLALSQIAVDFNLREDGYKLNFDIDGFKVDLFRRMHAHLGAEETVSIVKKMAEELESDNKKYIRLKVVGNPLDKKHLDTEIVLETEELLVMFDPQVIKVATDFANIKVNAENTEAALEAYGDIKSKATEAAAESLKSNVQKKKTFLQLDLNIKAITLLLYFNPEQKESHIWAIGLGEIKIYTDPESLLKPEFKFDEPNEEYTMKFVGISMAHYENKKSFFVKKAHKESAPPKSQLLNDLGMEFKLEMFKMASDEVPKMRGKAIMHDVGLNLSEFTYMAVQKIGDCFAPPKEVQAIQEKEKEKEKSIEKSEVMKNAKKIGILYEQAKDNDAKKYIAVLSGNFIYLYADKKDVQYVEYFYVKNAKFTYIKDTLPAQKQYAVLVENTVNKVTLGFEKEQLMEDWVKSIKSLDESEYQSRIIDEPALEKKQKSQKEAHPNLLNLEIQAEIQSISVTTILKSDKTITIGIEKLGTVVRLHEAKTLLSVSLKAISLRDNIYPYQYKELENFLYSSGFEGQDKLIDISIKQLAEEHPDYELVDSNITVNFGKLTCNYKPETVENVMMFFLPPSAQKEPAPADKVTQSSLQDQEQEERERKKRVALKIVCDILNQQPEKYSMKVNVVIEEISIALVNCKNHVMFAKMGLNRFKLLFGQSTRRMLLQGSMEEMWLADYSKYPYTIYTEQADYTHKDYIMSSNKHSRDMLTFDVQILQIPNLDGKTMVIDTAINDLKVSYVQQPVLRLITYLTEQMLPSLTPSDSSKPKEQPKNDIKPEESPMDLKTNLSNILVVIEPRSGLDEYLQLNVEKITVRNSSIYRPFIREPRSDQEKVLVENYGIELEGIRILERFRGDETKLTNDLDFSVSCDLIQNAPYYQKQFGSRFQPGMRIDCKMTPFVMRINHDDYNFMMKCLNWNVTFDDNAEGYMFNGAPKQEEAAPADPFYMSIDMAQIALCVTEEGIPITVLLLNKMKFDMLLNEAGMEMGLQIKHMFGTSITKVTEEESVEKGMFNAFGFEQRLQTKDLYEMESLEKLFSRKEMVYGESSKPVIQFDMAMGKEGDMFINLKIEALKIGIELRNLLILSKLALTEEYIQPPKSTIKPINKKVQPEPTKTGKMQIVIEMNNFMGSLSDKSGDNYVVMEGAFLVKLLMMPSKPESEIVEQAKTQKGRFRELSSHVIEIKDFSFYFCNIQDLKNKRFILMPLSLYLIYRQYYGQLKDTVYLETEIEGNLEKIIVEASVRDMLLVNKITQDNLQILADTNAEEERTKTSKLTRGDSTISNLKEEATIDTKAVDKTIKALEQQIKNKMKATFTLEPMQIRVVNDCDNNFMPVMNFVTQESKLMFVQDPIKGHLAQSLTLKLDFFNPRSSNWEPVIETFQISLDLLTLNTQYGPQNKIMITSSEFDELKELKLNVSTQFIASLMATLEIAKQENTKMGKVHNVKEIEVSPYIVQNKSYMDIIIHRKIDGKESLFKLPPQFKGPLRLSDNADVIVFSIEGVRYEISLEQYGLIRVPKFNPIHLEFKVNKLNRIITFVNQCVIKNFTESDIYCRRFNQKQELLDKEQVLIEKHELLSVEKSWSVQFSFNRKTFTTLTPVANLPSQNFVKAESEKFKLSVVESKVIGGHKMYYLRTPLVISNCLPKNLKLQFIKGGKTVSTKDIGAQTTHEVFANENILDLHFKVMVEGFYWSQEFGAAADKFGTECQMYLSDREKGGTTLNYIFEKLPKKNQVKFSIYCAAFIVSELNFNVEIYGNLKNAAKNKAIEKFYKLGGQSEYWKQEGVEYQGEERKLDKITLVGAETGSKVRICGENCLIDFSEPVSVGGLGINQSRIVVEKEIEGRTMPVFTVIGVEIELRKMVMTSDIITRQITIRSRSIVFNNSGYDLIIREEGCEVSLFKIANGEKKPFYTTAPDLKERPRGLFFKTNGAKESIPILSNGLGCIYFRLEKDEGGFLYFKMNVEEIQSYIYYEIKLTEDKDLPYQIVVRSEKLQAMVPQFNNRVVQKNSEPLMFINEIPHQAFNLRMEVGLVGGNRNEEVVVEVDNLNFRKKLRFYEEGDTKMFVPSVVYILFNDSKKFIVIDEMHNEEETTPEYDVQTINLKLEKMSISLIQNHAQVDKPYESFYFYFYNLEFILDKTNKRTRYQTKLQFLQLDQEEPFNIPSPVILTTAKYKQFTSTDPKDKPLAIFNSLIEIDNSFVKNMFFNQIVVDMNDLVLHASTPFLKLIMQLVKEYQEVTKSESEFYIVPKIDTWEGLEPPKEGSKTFIKSIKIAPFTIEISAELRLNELDTESVVFFGTIVNALGVVITNIEGAPIFFDGVIINDCVDTMQGINKKLIEHYKGSVMRQLYKVFGSLNILGNPVSLFRNISTGFKDLKDKPSEGFVEGPLEFGKGLAQGTSSLIAHSIGGALNSVQKVTGTIASGLAVLTFDKEFEEMREKEKMKKPKHVFEGLEKGGKAVFHGFKEGITGLFTKPYENTKKDGVLGFFKGTAQGVAGLVVKPVTGVVDFASKTTEGLKNTALYLEDKPNENRIRYPRVFYSESAMIREYNPVDSKLFAIISKTKYEDKYGFENTMFMDSFMISEREFLLVLKEDVAAVRIDNEKIEWAVPIEDMKIQESGEALIIESKRKREWYTGKVSEEVRFKNPEDKETVLKLVNELQITMKDRKNKLLVE